MRCAFDYCIYNKKSICILNEIQIDSLGMCEACHIVAIPNEILEALKNQRLKEVDERRKPTEAIEVTTGG